MKYNYQNRAVAFIKNFTLWLILSKAESCWKWQWLSLAEDGSGSVADRQTDRCKYVCMDRRTDPSYRKASLFKNISVP